MKKDDVKERVIRCKRQPKLCGLIGKPTYLVATCGHEVVGDQLKLCGLRGKPRYQVAACRHEVVGDYVTHFSQCWRMENVSMHNISSSVLDTF